MAKGFDNQKVNLFIGDGFEFLRTHKNEFDVIITDSSDPEGFNSYFIVRFYLLKFILKQFIGPAQSLFQDSYYELLKNALKPNGIVCCQGKNKKI